MFAPSTISVDVSLVSLAATTDTWPPGHDGQDDRDPLEARLWNVVSGIDDALRSEVTRADAAGDALFAASPLGTGIAGSALFFHYLHLARGNAAADELSRTILGHAIAGLAAGPMPMGLFEGVVGIAWLAEHIVGCQDDGEDINADVDEYLMDLLTDDLPHVSVDLIAGLVGIGVYGLERGTRGRGVAIVRRALTLIADRAVPMGGGVAWVQDRRLWPEQVRDRYPDKWVDLGVAHGTPGVLGFLARASRVPECRPVALAMLEQGIRYVLGQRLHGTTSWFAYRGSETGEPDPARCAWCYGDAGVASVLWLSGRALDRADLAALAVELSRDIAGRPLAVTGVRDASICHGAAGIFMHLLASYRATGDVIIRDGAVRWLRELLAMRQPTEPLGGYPMLHSQTVTAPVQWTPLAGILTGAAGVGLALLAAVSHTDASWQSVLLMRP